MQTGHETPQILKVGHKIHEIGVESICNYCQASLLTNIILVFTESKAVNEETMKIRQEFMLDSIRCMWFQFRIGANCIGNETASTLSTPHVVFINCFLARFIKAQEDHALKYQLGMLF